MIMRQELIPLGTVYVRPSTHPQNVESSNGSILDFILK